MRPGPFGEARERGLSPPPPLALLAAIVALLAGCSPSVTVAAGNPAARPRFADYRFDFSLVDDTVIAKQQIWLRGAQTNITGHEVPKLDMTVGAQVISTRFVDSTGTSLPVGMPDFFTLRAWEGYLKPGETDVFYFPFGGDVWFFTPESVQARLVGHTWGLAIRFSPHVFSETDSLKMKRPPLLLTVIEATGPELEATALLEKANAAVHAGTPEEWRAPCRELLQRFPQSRLADGALRLLYFLAKPSEQLEVAREQVRMNPGAPQLINWLAEIKDQLGVAVYNNFLKELARDHPKAAALEVLKEAK